VTRPIADPDPVTQPWWDATRDERLVVQRCDACGTHQHYPRALCTACASTELSFVEASGRAVVHSFTVVHRAPHDAFEPPYVVAIVELEEGPRMLTNIVGCEPSDVGCDMTVRVAWEPLPDGRKLPVFRPES
jgi:uncharacterized OB-fold protein